MSKYLLSLPLLLLLNLPAYGQVSELKDYQVFSVNSVEKLQPSGLSIIDGTLYSVSDKQAWIYRLKFSGDIVFMQQYKALDKKKLRTYKLDLEGISHVEGKFFLVSEAHHKLLVMDTDGEASWLPDNGNFHQQGYKSGLFQVHNAGLEGITYLGDQTFLLAVEREPRGLIKLKFDKKFKNIIEQKHMLLDKTDFPLDKNRSPDFTGLYYFEERIYVLQRNAYLISELTENNGSYKEGRAWSYRHIVEQADNRYQDMQFGHAEGLAVDKENFYLILDNNNVYKQNSPDDNRPLLIIAKRN